MATGALHPAMTAAAARRLRSPAPVHVAAGLAAAVGIAAGVALAIDVRVGVGLALVAVGVPIALLDPPLIIAGWAALTVFSRYPGFGLAASGAGLVVCGAWLAHARADSARVRAALRPHRRLLVVVALLLAWLTLSLTWSQDAAAAGAELVSWFVNAAALFVLLTSLRSPRDVHMLIGAVVCAVLASVVLGLAGVDAGGSTTVAGTTTSSQGRLQGIAGDPNFMAAFIVPSVVLAAVLTGVARTRWRIVLPAAVVALVVGLAATVSRGGLLAFLVVLAAGVVVMRGRRGVAIAAAVAALLTAGVWIAANPAAVQRIQYAQADRGNGREDLWRVAGRMAADHPLAGVGLGNFVVRSREYVRRPGAMDYVELVVDRPHVVHNTYLQMLAETGAVGLGLLLALVATVLASAVHAARRFERAGCHRLALLSRGVLVADLGLLTAAFFITAATTSTVWVLLALGPVLLGLSHASSLRRYPGFSRAGG